MNPAQRVLLRRLNEGPDTWADGTPLTFREELRNENAGWMTGREITALAMAAAPQPEEPPYPSLLQEWIDESIDFIERQRTP